MAFCGRMRVMSKFEEQLGISGPIIAPAPMDGVTDAAFRHMIAKYSRPSFIVTEFTNVEGLARGADEMLKAFIYEEGERPVIGQIYGVEVESFYKAAVMLCCLGFDGIDINMGCPVNKVAKHGSGAGLIQTPDLAREIIRSVKMGVKDFADGISMGDAGVHDNIIEGVKRMRRSDPERRMIPVSVKTRIGYDKPISVEWASILAEEKPDMICFHGRTLKQMYTAEANWDEIGAAAKPVKNAGICCAGNGDVHSMEAAYEKIEKFGVDGVEVGRAIFGKPWFFGGEEPDIKTRLKIALEHARYMHEKTPEINFLMMRKHLAWYAKGFVGAKELRMELMKMHTLSDIEQAIANFLA
ncbi:hypothetical protein GF354_05085 [Candidatus Peregrinibacteria bacterium]|nr:hypothetical protein [Candidatus Peregrinibacteria bacterium]